MNIQKKKYFTLTLLVCLTLSLIIPTSIYAMESNINPQSTSSQLNKEKNPPNVVEVNTNDGVRLDIIGRPSNKTSGSEHEAKKHAIKIDSQQRADSPSFTCPSTIRVALRPNNDPKASVSSVISVTFDTTSNTTDSYVKNVLPYEWYPTWPTESLKAGAMAIKMYGWYHTIVPKYPAIGADVDNTTNCQVYKPNGYLVTATSNAVNSINGIGFCRNWKNIEYYLFETSYYSGTYDGTATDGEHLTQNGTHYYADQGKTYSWMLNFYYNHADAYTYEQLFYY